MKVIITDPLEWTRIIERLKPILSVSSNKQWFRNGFGMLFIFWGSCDELTMA